MAMQPVAVEVAEYPPAEPAPNWRAKTLGTFTVWKPCALLRVGHTSEPLAQTAVESFYAKLLERARGADRAHFAPKFLVATGRENQSDCFRAYALLQSRLERGKVASGESFAVQMETPYGRWKQPTTEEAIGHNKTIASPDAAFQKRVVSGRYCPGIHYDGDPFLWAGCAELANWLEAGESSPGTWAAKLRENEQLLAKYRALYSYLRALGAAGARVVFFWNDPPISAIL
jgi:hypothetical protein